MWKWANLFGRCALALIFLISGAGKLMDYAGTQQYMRSGGVPGVLLPLVIALELGGGLALVIGWKTRYVAVLLALFSLLAAVLFHAHFADEMQTIMFLKNIAIAGGLAVLAERGSAAPSLDARGTAG